MKPSSLVWEHFTRIQDEGGMVLEAECKRCNKRFAGKHVVRKHACVYLGVEVPVVVKKRPCVLKKGKKRPRSPPHAPSSSGCVSVDSKASLEENEANEDQEPGQEEDKDATGDLARMIALGGYDPSVVDNDYFRSFVRGLNPEYEVPSREAIEEMCGGIFDEARKDAFSRLKHAPGRVSLAVGKTKTIEAGKAIYIACHFIDDEWKLHKTVIETVVPNGLHYSEDGPILGFDILPEHASSNSILAVILAHERRLSTVAYKGTSGKLYSGLEECIEHINEGGTNLKCTTTTYVDNVLHSIAHLFLPDREFTEAMFRGMTDLDLSRQERLQLFLELDLLGYEWAPYDERWCACYFSLEVLRKRGCTALVYADLFEKLLFKVWEQVYRSIQIISASTCPTSNLCLGELLKLRETLQRLSEDGPVVQGGYNYFISREKAVDVLKEASDTLDEAIQDSYLVWSVPLALDPRYKLNYIEFSFKRAFSSEAADNYVSQVTTMIKKLYADYVEEYSTITTADHSDSDSANAMMTTTRVHPWEQAWNEHCHSQENLTTELDRYLQDGLVPATKDFDVLKWWKVHSSEYPTVARMARDALAMPTSSKLPSDQIAQVRSILRGYYKKPYRSAQFFAYPPTP